MVQSSGRRGPVGFGIAGVALSGAALFITFIMYVVIGAAAATSPSTTTSTSEAPPAAESTEPSETTEKAEAPNTMKSDDSFDTATNTFTGTDATIRIDKCVTSTDISGDPVVSVYFTITNNESKEQNVLSLYWDAVEGVYQNNGTTRNSLNMAILFDSENNHLNDNLLPGATISGRYDYKLESNSLPIEIEFSNGHWGSTKHVLTMQP